jgi:hypothetical protein
VPDGDDRSSDLLDARSSVTPSPSRSRTGVGTLVHQTMHDLGLRREADMMGLYVSLTLLAVLLTGNDLDEHTKLDVLWIVWGTTIGLAVAHWFALVMSVRLVRDPHVHHSPMEMLLAQMVMSALLAMTATLVVVVLPERFDRLGARLTAAFFIGAIVYGESRFSGRSARRAAALGAFVLAIAMSIATFKWYISY